MRRFAFLDGIRGVAAIFVLTGHTGDYWHLNFHRAYLAVDLFFILSGFVIAHAYDDKLRAGTISAGGFLKIRWIRLYPVFLLSIPLCAVTLICTKITAGNISFKSCLDIGFAITMTVFFIPYHMAGSPYLFALNSAYWSLFFELVANAAYVFMRPQLDRSRLMKIIIALGLGMAALAFIHGNLNAGDKWTLPHVGAGLLRSIFGIFVGLFIYQNHTSFLSSSKNVSPWLAFFCIVIVLASPSVSALDALIDLLCVFIVFPLCVLVASRDTVSAFEDAMLVLGSASYPIYVFHAPVANIVLNSWPEVSAYAPISGVALVIFLVALGVLLERKYDIRVRRKLTGAFVRRPS